MHFDAGHLHTLTRRSMDEPDRGRQRESLEADWKLAEEEGEGVEDRRTEVAENNSHSKPT